MKNFLVILFIITSLVGCGKSVELTGFDNKAWKDDPNGCQGDRLRLIDSLKSNSDKLKGLSQGDVVRLLGRPDRNELYKRNQKFFEYQITPDKMCDVPNNSDDNFYLSIRFNATGLAKEIQIYQESQK